MKALAVVIGGLALTAGLASRSAAAAPVSRWEQSGPPYAVIHSIEVAQDGSDALYAAASDSATPQSAAFRSDDAGATWTLLASTLPGDTASTIAVDPRDARRVFATAFRRESGLSTRLYVSVDSAATWRLAGDFPTACGGTFAFGTSDSLAVYVNLGCSGELLASEDAGLTWQSRNSSLRLLRSGPGGVLYAVRGLGIVSSADGGLSWVEVGFGPCPGFINALAVDPLGRLLVGTGRLRMIFIECAGLFRSNDGGVTWTRISPMYVNDIVVDSSEPSRIYAASFPPVHRGDVFATADDGVHWRALNLSTPTFGLALSSSGRLLHAGTRQGLYRLSIRKNLVVPPR